MIIMAEKKKNKRMKNVCTSLAISTGILIVGIVVGRKIAKHYQAKKQLQASYNQDDIA